MSSNESSSRASFYFRQIVYLSTLRSGVRKRRLLIAPILFALARRAYTCMRPGSKGFPYPQKTSIDACGDTSEGSCAGVCLCTCGGCGLAPARALFRRQTLVVICCRGHGINRVPGRRQIRLQLLCLRWRCPSVPTLLGRRTGRPCVHLGA